MDAAAYRQFVELEERHWWFAGRRAIFGALLERELGTRRGLRILDAGCGAGGMLALLSRFGTVSGLDTSEEMAAMCRERGFADVTVGSATEPLGGPFDLVALFDTIEHVDDDGLVLRRSREALAPDGRVIVTVPAYQFLYANNDRVVHHRRRYTAPALRRKLAGAGLEPLHVTYFNTILFPLILPVVLLKKVHERLVDPGKRTNLSGVPPAPVNRALGAIMSAERHVAGRVELPFGHSIAAVARPS